MLLWNRIWTWSTWCWSPSPPHDYQRQCEMQQASGLSSICVWLDFITDGAAMEVIKRLACITDQVGLYCWLDCEKAWNEVQGFGQWNCGTVCSRLKRELSKVDLQVMELVSGQLQRLDSCSQQAGPRGTKKPRLRKTAGPGHQDSQHLSQCLPLKIKSHKNIFVFWTKAFSAVDDFFFSLSATWSIFSQFVSPVLCPSNN